MFLSANTLVVVFFRMRRVRADYSPVVHSSCHSRQRQRKPLPLALDLPRPVFSVLEESYHGRDGPLPDYFAKSLGLLCKTLIDFRSMDLALPFRELSPPPAPTVSASSRFPFEIWAQIFSQLDRRHVVPLTRTSRATQGPAVRRLYREIYFCWGYWEYFSRGEYHRRLHGPTSTHFNRGYTPQNPPAPLLLRTLLLNPNLANEIQTFSLVGEPLLRWRAGLVKECDSDIERKLRDEAPPRIPFSLDSFTIKELAAFASNMSQLGYATEDLELLQLQGYGLIVLMSLLSRLERLEVDSDFFRSRTFVKELRKFVKSGRFNGLKSVKLCADVRYFPFKDIKAVEPWEKTLLCPLKLPSLQHLDINTTLRRRELVRLSSITSLIIRHWDPVRGPTYFREHLEKMPCLRSLEYREWLQDHLPGHQTRKLSPLYDDVWTHRAWEARQIPDTIFSNIHPVCASLERLVFSARFFSPAYHRVWDNLISGDLQDQWGLLTHLTQFPRLRMLEVPWVLLLGYLPGQNTIQNWRDVLPDSLRDITWTDYMTEIIEGDDMENWDDALMANWAHLAPWFASCRSRPDEPLHFGLKIMREDNYDFETKVVQAGHHLYYSKHVEQSYIDRVRSWQPVDEVGIPDVAERAEELFATFGISFTCYRRGPETGLQRRLRGT